MTVFGYARVSTDGQSLDTQRDQLLAAGAVKVFEETESGAKRDRPQLVRAIVMLDKGDVLLVTRLDRLARSTLDLLKILEQVDKRKAKFKSLSDNWCDTTMSHGKLMITVLGGVAEFERSLILARCNEGRVRAKSNGVKFGRKHKLTEHQKQQAIELRAQGRSQKEIGKLLNVSHQTIGRLHSFHDLFSAYWKAGKKDSLS